MYWCKLRLFTTIAFIGGVMLGGIACRPDVKDTGNKYFDIKGYFTADTLRLKKLNKLVTKTVTHNGVTETKKVKIANWGQELDMFIGADINKPAWKNSYTVFNSDNVLLYKAKDEDLKVREVMIKLDKQKVKWMLIFTRTQNILYKTTERLSYFPDSLYLIQKDQHIKLMGNNHYIIQGVIER
ncbi:hypothetical protein KXD93_11100 [Mucilaginibacter sp. BJC16-A38]|uniref:hypothetical protein n=1 Tax=Mucilaginibacter phenanthrenivorans TaxID=1234842 RepID=UPI0021571DDE|nr:hypothetical protein [Mucilaginibacter phenanthrenivorans]MCR8558195.1 hypothetical protein [Mucilaginibacter phenanthrenivorans]